MGYTDDVILERYEELGQLDDLPVYSNIEAQRFVVEATDAGFTVEHYHGRYMAQGPAIRVDDLAEGIRAVSTDVRWDSMGYGYIVYGPQDEGTWPE